MSYLLNFPKRYLSLITIGLLLAAGCGPGDKQSNSSTSNMTTVDAGGGEDAADNADNSDNADAGSDNNDTGSNNSNADMGSGETDADTCGDGVLDAGEECDGTELDGATCESEGFSSGEISCSDTCTLDTSQCVTQVCGNGIVEGTEVCDGAELQGATCASEGFTDGDISCNANCDAFDTSLCTTCGDGQVEGDEVCDDGNTVDDFTCAADCSIVCPSGYGECANGVSTYCTADGTTTATETCDSLQGMTCDANTGLCDGACSRQSLDQSHIGCEFFPTITANPANSTTYSFAVVLLNTTNVAANVDIQRGGTAVTTTTVAANGVEIVELPWVTNLNNAGSGTAISMLEIDGGYHLRSTQPLTVYQYNPIRLATDVGFSSTTEASLLLPTQVWGDQFSVISRQHWSTYSAFYAVTAMTDNTTVALTSPPTGATFAAGGGVDSQGTGMLTLNSGDVLQVFTSSGDLTGASVASSAPVQVIGGHACTNIPTDTIYCDHLEESLFPVNTLSTTHVLTAPLTPSDATVARTIRIVATAPNTTLTYDPAPIGAPTSITAAGEVVELQTDTDFSVTASEPILVGEFMHGNSATGAGDPAFVLNPATAQYRGDYLFHAPTTYTASFVNIVAPTTATVQLDGDAVTDWQVIGTSGYQVARELLDDSGNGSHTITSTEPVGATVYGYGQYNSDWYPAGANFIPNP